MRSRLTLILCLAMLGGQTASTTPDALLQRGIASYRAARYAEAAKDLKSAADAMLSSEEMQAYVNSGKFANLDKFETALVYLTLAETKLGRTAQAKEAVLRLETAEHIENVYAHLPLEADAAEFPSIAARLVPGTKLAGNAQPAPVQQPAPAVNEAADRQRAIDEAVAKERARIQKEADARIAAERASQRSGTEYLVRLRQADAYADNGDMNRADDLYVSIANAPDAPRDIVAEAGVGLYRISAFRDAVNVFRKLSPFGRGEEDLRYYNAVALYETGDIATAKRELECSLPFIVENEDVTRYRAKIEGTR